MEIIAAVALGFALDLIFGDPEGFPHPIRLIGALINKGEKILRRILPASEKGELVGGFLLTIVVAGVSFALPMLILWAAAFVNIYLKVAVEAFFCYQIFAAKSLKVASMRVYNHLFAGDMAGARKYLSWIVGRDTENLGSEKIVKATVETVAENTSDGVVAPMIFMIIGGAPLGFFYKAVNTLDSMIGYKNEKYLYFGRFAARLDDVLNFLPAIFSAWFMLAASFFMRFDFKNALKIYRRDKHNHSSPNSAKTEAVCAGALGLQLGGDSYYFGQLVQKQTIGDEIRTAEIADIPRVNRLMYGIAALSLVVFLGLRSLIIGVIIL